MRTSMEGSLSTSEKQALLRLLAERERRTKRPETAEEAKRLSASFAEFAEIAWSLIQPGVVLLKGIICASHGGNLALRDSVRRRDYIIASEWYQSRWGDRVKLLESQQTKSEFLNTAGGFMFSTSVGGDVLGRRWEISVLDDPHKVDEAESEIERVNTAQWLNLEWATRRNRGASVTGEICIMQRLHESDTSGIYLKQGGWTHLMLPMYFEPERKCSTSIGWTDPRTAKDEVLDSALNTEPARKDLEVRLGPYGRAGQFQQRPAPLEGGIIKRSEERRVGK